MFTFLKIGWKNLFRHRRRTALTGLAMTVGTVMVIFGSSYSDSVLQGLVSGAIYSITGHIQVHAKDAEVGSIMSSWKSNVPAILNPEDVMRIAKSEPRVKAASGRVRFDSLIATDEEQIPASLMGVEPRVEPEITPRVRVTKGRYLSSAGPGIILREGMAARLKAKIGDGLVLMAPTPDGYMNAALVSLQGIYDSPGMDQFMFWGYVDLKTAQELMGYDDEVMEVVLSVERNDDVPKVIDSMKRKFKAGSLQLRVDSWQVPGSLLFGIASGIRASVLVSTIILLIVVAAGITNTMLMSVYERTREVGTMASLGMKRRGVLSLFALEGLLLGLLAGGVGTLIGSAACLILAKVGIPAVSDAMKFGYGGDRLYLVLTWRNVLFSFALTVFLGTLSSLYPANIASKMKPVEALRFV